MTISENRRWWALGALGLGVLTLGFDITIMNVALPTIASSLSVGTDGLQWMVNAYVLVLAGFMLTAGALGDRYGRKRLIVAGLALLGLASAAAAWASTATLVIVARAVMGVGAAIIIPTAFAVLAVLFAPAERAKAVAVMMMGLGVGIPLGPIIGGLLLDHFWWGSIFLVNVPIAVIGILAIAILLPESADPAPPRPDLLGALLSIAGLVSLVYGLIEAPSRGWSDPLVLGTVLLGAALLVIFRWWESHTSHPMIDLRLFGRAQFLWGSVAGVLVTFGLLGLLFVVPQYLQLVAGNDALGTGLRLLPLIAGLIIGAPAGERLAARTRYRVPVALGLLLLAIGLGLGATTETDTGYGVVAGWLGLAGLGTGLALSPAMDAVLGALPTEQSGSGTAISMTLRQTGGALGVALLGSILAQGYTQRLPTDGLLPQQAETARDSIAGALNVAAQLGDSMLAGDARAAYLHGMTLVLLTAAVIALISAAIIAAVMPGKPTTGNEHPDQVGAAPQYVDPVDPTR